MYIYITYLFMFALSFLLLYIYIYILQVCVSLLHAIAIGPMTTGYLHDSFYFPLFN